MVAIALTATTTLSQYNQAKAQQDSIDRYGRILDQSEELGLLRETLLQSYDGVSTEDRERLEKFLPRNIDIVRLTLEIDRIAVERDLEISDLEFEEREALDNVRVAEDSVAPDDQETAANAQESFGNYSSVRMSFNVTASYEEFLLFLEDLEQNLRLSDVQAISFRAESTEEEASDEYDFTISFNTYWLGT